MRQHPLLSAAAALLCAGLPAYAQVADRILTTPSTTAAAPVAQSVHPLVKTASDLGRAPGSTAMAAMHLSFAMSAEQQADLKALLAAQLDPASAQYHQWLSPAQFGARFGASAHDLALAQQWLQAQGFTVTSVPANHLDIEFSGTVTQVETAFHTEMHRYNAVGQSTVRLANASTYELPTAFSGVVSGVRNLAQFRPRPMHTLHPNYTTTSGTTTEHYLVPSDIETIYGVTQLYNAGLNGTGQTIVIVGQSAISTTDISDFRTAAGLGAPNLTQTIVPGSGSSVVTDGDDEAESDLDIEWSGAIAQNAGINFVYTGSNTDYGVFDALEYAVDNKLAPILSMSYGSCEQDLQSTDVTSLESILMQANSQGQTVFAASGDAGSTACDQGDTGDATQGLSVNYPASSAYVTGVGGTQFNEGAGTYWNTTNNATGGSATGYIPEAGWDEATTSIANMEGPEGSGGGASVLFGKPGWQSATGVPADGARDVPDIALDSAVFHDSYIFCTPATQAGVTSSTCTNGFAGAVTANSLAGGTSFASPIVAGIMSLVNQRVTSATGATSPVYLGNINPQLYTLFGTTPAAFNDITTGNNDEPCTAGSPNCTNGTEGYNATVGYDQVTGLGSINAYTLAEAFPTTTTQTSGSLITTSTGLTSSNSSPVTGTALSFYVTLTSSTGTTTAPTGTMTLSLDGTQVQSATVSAFSTATSSGSTYALTYLTSSLTAGAHTLVAKYSGDGTYAASSSTLNINVISASSQGSFTLAVANATLPTGTTSVNATLTATSAGNYSGTLDFSLEVPNNFTGCVVGSDGLFVPAGGAGTESITVYSSEASCTEVARRGAQLLPMTKLPAKAARLEVPGQPGGTGSSKAPVEALAGLLLCVGGVMGRKRKGWPVAVLLVLGSLGTVAGLSGCGGSSGGNIPINSSGAGTYTLQVTANDVRYPNLTATTTFTVTIQ